MAKLSPVSTGFGFHARVSYVSATTCWNMLVFPPCWRQAPGKRAHRPALRQGKSITVLKMTLKTQVSRIHPLLCHFRHRRATGDATARCKWLRLQKKETLGKQRMFSEWLYLAVQKFPPWSLVLCTPEALDPPQGIASSCPSPATLTLFAFFPVIFPFPEGQETYQGDRFTPHALWLSKYQ